MGRTKRLIITMPPRHGKSELCSKYFPAWYLGNFPDRRIILTSYEATFAASWGRKARDVFEEVGLALFDKTVSQVSGAAAAWDIQGHQGGMNTAGVGGPITGKGAHVLIIDDPIKNQDDARSETIRTTAKNWYMSTAYTRLEAEPEGAIILIMTRWHEDDLAGWLLKLAEDDPEADQWEVFNLPAIAEETRDKQGRLVPDAIGREPGEALWPKRFPIERLQRIKRSLEMGAFWFSAMYQQRPQPATGSIWKLPWFKVADGLPTSYDSMVQAWDTAQKQNELNDYSACATVGMKTNTAYVLNVYRARLDSPNLLRAIKEQYRLWRPQIIVIEDASSGTSAYQTLKKESKLPVVLQSTQGKDKVARANIVTPYVEGGRVLFAPGAWYSDLVAELLSFPLGTHDDMNDALVYALIRLFTRSIRKVQQHGG